MNDRNLNTSVLTDEGAVALRSLGSSLVAVVVGTEYDPDSHEPVRTELLTPLYRHGEVT